MTHVPYKGVTQYNPDLIGGLVDLAFTTTAASIAHLQTGKLRAIGVTGVNRAAEIPSVPPLPSKACPDSMKSPGCCWWDRPVFRPSL